MLRGDPYGRQKFRFITLLESIVLVAIIGMAIPAVLRCSAQSISSGTITGTVTDPSGAVVVGARVEISNAITGYQRTTTTDTDGTFRFGNVPFNLYHLRVIQSGFTPIAQNADVRSTVPVTLKIELPVAGVNAEVTVEAEGNIIETEPSAHSDVDLSMLSKLPITMAGSGLSEAVTMMAPGVVNDSNGFFHPTGDHASYSMQLDGQPINDQFSKSFSTQIPLNALQAVELVTGFPSAEYGEKTSLIMNATSRSGLGLATATGSIEFSYGSFGTTEDSTSLGLGSAKFGDFFVANGSRSGRFLDTPEFVPIHAIGNDGSFFDRFDYQPGGKDVFHLNLFAARNWFQIPNTYDQQSAGQDQRQRVLSYNVAPGYQHTFNPNTLLTINGWLRQDQVNYYPSADKFNDTPATISQQRRLMNLGGRSAVDYSRGNHNLKFGVQIMQTRLAEGFQMGITDLTFNDPSSPGFLPGLAPYDLTRGGTLLRFNAADNINEYASYVTDKIKWGNFTLTPGLRVTRYDGVAQATGVQPRIGVSYLLKDTGTVFRASYAHTLETPANENLLLSSSTGTGGLANVFGASGQAPVPASRRTQFNIGFQQTFGHYLQVDADYYWKYASPAFEFDVLFTTPIAFPIAWRKDKIDGFGIRVSTTNLKGFQLNTTMGYGRLRYFGPETGGLIFNSPLTTVFRTDSDDPFYQTTMTRYQWKKNGPWIAATWKYDFGEVSGGGGSLDDILTLSGDQQHMMGFFCGNNVATPTSKISVCNLPYGQYGATRVRIPAPGTENDDHNPPRVATRDVFDLAAGTDNLFRGDNKRVTLQFTVVNISNVASLYNFLSTFGGTHFVQPRSYQVKLGYVF